MAKLNDSDQQNHAKNANEETRSNEQETALERSVQNLIGVLNLVRAKGHDLASIRYFPDPPFSLDALLAVVNEETKWIKQELYHSFLPSPKEHRKEYDRRWTEGKCISAVVKFIQECNEAGISPSMKNYQKWRNNSWRVPHAATIAAHSSWETIKVKALAQINTSPTINNKTDTNK